MESEKSTVKSVAFPFLQVIISHDLGPFKKKYLPSLFVLVCLFKYVATYHASIGALSVCSEQWCAKTLITSYYRKNPNGGAVSKTKFFEKDPGLFFFLPHYLPLVGYNKTSLLEILQNGILHFENFKFKNQYPWKFHIIFS